MPRREPTFPYIYFQITTFQSARKKYFQRDLNFFLKQKKKKVYTESRLWSEKVVLDKSGGVTEAFCSSNQSLQLSHKLWSGLWTPRPGLFSRFHQSFGVPGD